MISINQAFQGWHPGEQAVQKLMCLPERVPIAAIVDKLPDQHRIFHSSRLHYVPVTTLDDEGRPWASVLCSSEGTPGFIQCPTNTALHIRARVWPGDPIFHTVTHDESGKDRSFASGIGLEPSTRRRNKFSGWVTHARLDASDLTLELSVSHALGLCPKYIQVRDLEPYPNATPRVIHDRWHLAQGERLPDDVVQFIHQADTAYLATSYVARPEDASVHPSRVGTNHRGGRPGFVRVRPADGRTLVLPNYNGNRMMNSLGNIFVTPLAGIVFPSFTTGAILYVSGTAETLFGETAKKLMPSASAVTTIRVTGFAFVEDAMPIRETPNTAEISPYCPPICYLSEEIPPENPYADISLLLVKTRVHNNTLATFTFEASRPVHVHASQNAVLDLSHFVRERAGTLLDDWKPDASRWAASDDCVRTWTVSVPPTLVAPSTFSLTVRWVKHGLVTPIMHRLAHKVDPHLDQHPPTGAGTAIDVSALRIGAQLRGVGGTLPLPEPCAACDGGRRLLWIAGGIGLTPFLGLTRYVTGLARQTYGVWDVALVVSSREPEVMLSLVCEAYGGRDPALVGGGDGSCDGDGCGDSRPPVDLIFSIHLFTDRSPATFTDRLPHLPADVSVTLHKGRIDQNGMFFESVGARNREAHICGPLPFVNNAMASLVAAGVDPESVLRERFTY